MSTINPDSQHSISQEHYVPVKKSFYNNFAAKYLKIAGSDFVNKTFAFFNNENAKLNVEVKKNFHGTASPQTEICGGDTIEAYDALMKLAKETNPGAALETKVTITRLSSIDAAKQLVDPEGDNSIAILNLANRIRPGGVGATPRGGSQEENLFRRSNLRYGINRKINTAFDTALHDAFTDKKMTSDSSSKHIKERHHIPYLGALHSKDVTFFEKKKTNTFDVISAAGIDLRPEAEEYSVYMKKNDKGKLKLDEAKFREVTEKKVDAILATALINGNKKIVLSAIGCGAFGNDPLIVADCFKKALEKEEFKNKFEEVVFAVYVPPNKSDPLQDKNYASFANIIE